MKIIRVILTIILVLVMTSCEKKNNNQDFWIATINVLEDKLENNSYNDNNWQINVEDEAFAKDKDYRGLSIHKFSKDKSLSKTTILSFQNQNNLKTISYHYINKEQ